MKRYLSALASLVHPFARLDLRMRIMQIKSCRMRMAFESCRRWDAQSEQVQVEASYEGHSDWVNSIAVIEDMLVSCSSDTLVQFWQKDATGERAVWHIKPAVLPCAS